MNRKLFSKLSIPFAVLLITVSLISYNAFAQQRGAAAGDQAAAGGLAPERELAMKIKGQFTLVGVGRSNPHHHKEMI